MAKGSGGAGRGSGREASGDLRRQAEEAFSSIVANRALYGTGANQIVSGQVAAGRATMAQQAQNVAATSQRAQQIISKAQSGLTRVSREISSLEAKLSANQARTGGASWAGKPLSAKTVKPYRKRLTALRTQQQEYQDAINRLR